MSTLPLTEAKELVLTPPEPAVLTPMELMTQVLKTQNPRDAVEVVKELAKLQMDMQYRDAEIEFNRSLALAQAEMKLVINDSDPAKTAPGGKRWSTYRALNKHAKPIWQRQGMSVSYDSLPSANPDQMTMIAHVSKGLYTRDYSLPMDISGKGPKGEGAMSKPHAIGAGLEYGRRDLIRMIFDLITGEEETLTSVSADQDWVADQIAEFARCETPEGLQAAFQAAATIALEQVKDLRAYQTLKDAKNARKKELANAK